MRSIFFLSFLFTILNPFLFSTFVSAQWTGGDDGEQEGSPLQYFKGSPESVPPNWRSISTMPSSSPSAANGPRYWNAIDPDMPPSIPVGYPNPCYEGTECYDKSSPKTPPSSPAIPVINPGRRGGHPPGVGRHPPVNGRVVGRHPPDQNGRPRGKHSRGKNGRKKGGHGRGVGRHPPGVGGHKYPKD